MKRMQCSCCGNGTIGRQWWNRDTGYGLCAWCVPFILSHKTTPDELERGYGKPGHHFAILLEPGLPVGALVAWAQVDGERLTGVLKEWDNGTAIVRVDGKDCAVRAA